MKTPVNRRSRKCLRVLIALLLYVMACAWTVFPRRTFAQDAAETAAAPPSSDGSMLLPDQTDVIGSLRWQPGTNDSVKAPLSAALLAEPTYGTAPLTVDFYVSLANPRSSLLYQWDFGDGAVSSLPASAYIPHVYQRPGTYFCSLTLTNGQKISTTLLTTVTVLPRQG
jgi:PKD repeat protein